MASAIKQIYVWKHTKRCTHRCSIHQSCVLAYGMREAVCVYVCAARPPTHPHGIPPTSGLPPIAAQSAFARRVHTGRLDVQARPSVFLGTAWCEGVCPRSSVAELARYAETCEEKGNSVRISFIVYLLALSPTRVLSLCAFVWRRKFKRRKKSFFVVWLP